MMPPNFPPKIVMVIMRPDGTPQDPDDPDGHTADVDCPPCMTAYREASDRFAADILGDDEWMGVTKLIVEMHELLHAHIHGGDGADMFGVNINRLIVVMLERPEVKAAGARLGLYSEGNSTDE